MYCFYKIIIIIKMTNVLGPINNSDMAKKKNQTNRNSRCTKASMLVGWIFMYVEISGHFECKNGVLKVLLLTFRYDTAHDKGERIGYVHYPVWMFISITCPAGSFKYPPVFTAHPSC